MCRLATLFPVLARRFAEEDVGVDLTKSLFNLCETRILVAIAGRAYNNDPCFSIDFASGGMIGGSRAGPERPLQFSGFIYRLCANIVGARNIRFDRLD